MSHCCDMDDETSKDELKDAVELQFASMSLPERGVVIFQFKEPIDTQQRVTLSKSMGHYLSAYAPNCVALICGPETSIYMLPPDKMAELGWIRAPRTLKEKIKWMISQR